MAQAGAGAPSTEEILTEIEPFLEAIDFRMWSERVHRHVLTWMGHAPEVSWTSTSHISVVPDDNDYK